MSLANHIAKLIIEVAESEDTILSDIADEGIFHMPELAFVYECGKKIMGHSKAVFGSNTVKWKRETDLGNGGPTDLLFELNDGYRVVLEFKLRDTRHAYIRDVEKLSKLDDKKTLRLFCALIDIFDKDLQTDERLNTVENINEIDVLLVARKDFSTKQYRYPSSPVLICVAAVWTVGDVPIIKV